MCKQFVASYHEINIFTQRSIKKVISKWLAEPLSSTVEFVAFNVSIDLTAPIVFAASTIFARKTEARNILAIVGAFMGEETRCISLCAAQY